MDSKKIYRRLTMNIQNKISKFKEGKSTRDHLNDQLTINICSLCRFLKKREDEKKMSVKNSSKISDDNKEQAETNDTEDKASNLNETILDIFVPYSRLSKSIQSKLDSLSTPVIEEEEENNFLDKENSFANSFDDDNLAHLIADEDAENDKIFDCSENCNTDFLNDDASVSMSLFEKPLIKVKSEEVMYNDDISNYPRKREKKKNKSEMDLNRDMKNSNEISMFKVSSAECLQKLQKMEEAINKDDENKRAQSDFKNILKPKIITNYIKEMSYDYLKYMQDIYNIMTAKDNKSIITPKDKSLYFINQFKSFILEIGISDKKFYEECIREIIYKPDLFEFSQFLDCFKQLNNLKFDKTFLKYKFAFHIIRRENKEIFTQEELDNFFRLLVGCERLNDPEILEDINCNLVRKYMKIFPKSDGTLYTRKLTLVLEQFFDLK